MYEFTDRYSATGTPYPHPLTVCGGGCEGMGYYPHRAHDPLPSYYEKYPHMVGVDVQTHPEETDYERAEVARIQSEQGMEEDGWYFIRCDDCGGTGKVTSVRESLRRIPGWLWDKATFVWHCGIRDYPGLSSGETRLQRFWNTLQIALGIHAVQRNR